MCELFVYPRAYHPAIAMVTTVKIFGNATAITDATELTGAYASVHR